MVQTDGKYKLIDGHHWGTEVTIQNDLVVEADGLYGQYLLGLTLRGLQELAKDRHLELKQL